MSGAAGDPRPRVGRLGEEAAARALARKGLRLVARRWRSCGAEIDLVAEDGSLVVFVEVKTRRGGGFGSPAEAVTAPKRRRIARAALALLAQRGWLERPCRFDVVEVFVEGERVRDLRHLVDAFRPAAGDTEHGTRRRTSARRRG